MSSECFHFGLIGWPVGHSRSPALHRAALAALGLAGSYDLFPVPPMPAGEASLRELLARLRGGELNGLNVTVPHKVAVWSRIDAATPPALAIGAANTLFIECDRLVGDNTDADGFLADVTRLFPAFFDEQPAPGARRPAALVLGAGGSARAVVYALRQAGWTVVVAARRVAQAQALVMHFSAISTPPLVGIPLDAPSVAAAQSHFPVVLVVNATPAGMSPRLDETAWPAGVSFPTGAAVYDLVYNPQETLLVRLARRAGLQAETGCGMLVEQAALSFERWTGMGASREAMRRALEKEFGKG